MNARTQTDFGRLGIVVEHIERIIQQLQTRPKTHSMHAAVVEFLRLETSRVLEDTRGDFDPFRDNAVVNGILGQSS